MHALAAAFPVVEMAYPAVSVLVAVMVLALPVVAVAAAAMVSAVAVAAAMVPAVAVAAAMVPAVAVVPAVMVPAVVVAFLVLYCLLASRSFGGHFHDQKPQDWVCRARLDLFRLFHLCHDQGFFLVVCLAPGAPPA